MLALVSGAVLSACAASAPARTAPVADVVPYAVPREGEALLRSIRQVSAGTRHTCALVVDGSVWCWGDNAVGQLGDGTRQDRDAPVRVRALPPARWVAAGARSTCAATLDGEVYCWGANSVGQLGNGEVANGYSLPVRARGVERAWQTVGSTTAERFCAITDAGGIACWGRLAMMGRDGRPAIGSAEPDLDVAIHDAVAIAIGQSHECVLTEEGRVRCRGLGEHGELGNGITTTVERRFVPVAELDRVVSIAAGRNHTCAVRADGTAWCWGKNDRGQLGHGGLDEARTPVRVELPAAVRAVVAGDAHTCAMGERGDVYCWGDNRHSELGEGMESARLAPSAVRVGGHAHDLAAGAQHTCALLMSGELRCWGGNMGGQLGDGTTDERAWPVAVLSAREEARGVAVAAR